MLVSPDRVAESETDCPTFIFDEESLVEIVGLALPTVRLNAPELGALLGSPG